LVAVCTEDNDNDVCSTPLTAENHGDDGTPSGKPRSAKRKTRNVPDGNVQSALAPARQRDENDTKESCSVPSRSCGKAGHRKPSASGQSPKRKVRKAADCNVRSPSRATHHAGESGCGDEAVNVNPDVEPESADESDDEKDAGRRPRTHIIGTNQADDFLHRGGVEPLASMGIVHYSMFVYSATRGSTKPSDRVFEYVDHYSKRSQYVQVLRTVFRVPVIQGFTLPTRERDEQTNTMFKSVLFQPYKCEAELQCNECVCKVLGSVLQCGAGQRSGLRLSNR